jgi:hypothetical protein
MKRILLVSLLLVFLAFALTACGGQSTPEVEAAPQVNIKVETAPDPLAVGDAELSFIITDQNGGPIEGAKVDVGADHTDMTGMGMHGPAAEQGNGRYAIKANFSMSGNWKITVYVRKGDLDVEQDILFVIK